MAKLSEHFDEKEFQCHCCNQLPKQGIDSELIDLLEGIRNKLDKPITIMSGYRCEDHNTKCGGAPKSQHVLGTAADIKIAGMSAAEVHMFIEHNFYKRAKGLGKYPSFVHLDVREGPIARWNGNA